jgi:hypothetical protein
MVFPPPAACRPEEAKAGPEEKGRNEEIWSCGRMTTFGVFSEIGRVVIENGIKVVQYEN